MRHNNNNNNNNNNDDDDDDDDDVQRNCNVQCKANEGSLQVLPLVRPQFGLRRVGR
jgi:hypothetical protein